MTQAVKCINYQKWKAKNEIYFVLVWSCYLKIQTNLERSTATLFKSRANQRQQVLEISWFNHVHKLKFLLKNLNLELESFPGFLAHFPQLVTFEIQKPLIFHPPERNVISRPIKAIIVGCLSIMNYLAIIYWTEGFCEDGEKPVIKIEPSNVTELKKRPAKRSRIDEQGQGQGI